MYKEAGRPTTLNVGCSLHLLSPGLNGKESELHTSLHVHAVEAVKRVCFFLKNCFSFGLHVEVRTLAGVGSLLPSFVSSDQLTLVANALYPDPPCHTPLFAIFLLLIRICA